MLLINNRNTTDPAINLSIEEYCLGNLNPKNDYMLLYIDDPAVIIGKNQNPFKETDLAYVKKNRIPIFRRISGGGAVYHDHGNLNFSFITAFGKKGLNEFRYLLGPVLTTLDRLGVHPKLMDNNTIFIRMKKVSGNAQYTNLKRMLSHGTLLFDADLTALDRALDSKSDIFNSKAVESSRACVTNLSGYLKESIDIQAFRDRLMAAAKNSFNGLEAYHLSDVAWDAILELAREKYRSWKWNFGSTPSFMVRNRFIYGSHTLSVGFNITRGMVQHMEFEGGNPGREIVAIFEKKLIGNRYDPENLGRLSTSG